MPKFEEALSFDDVSLRDGFSTLQSRSQVSLLQEIGAMTLGLPVATASMASICSEEMAAEVLRAGGMYVHHRYCSVSERVEFGEGLLRSGIDRPDLFESWPILGTAVGLDENTAEIAELAEVFDLISLDVAAANNERVMYRIQELTDVIEDCLTNRPLLMVGNFSDTSFVHALIRTGCASKVDLLKVSQGGGSVCSTRTNIGIGVPTFQAILDLRARLDEFSQTSHIGVVADGGIRTTGDMVKAFAAGACVAMCGGLFAGHEECPGELHHIDHVPYKEFSGMASRVEKERGDKALHHIEGVSSLVPFRGPVGPLLSRIRENIQSGVATAGYDSLEEFKGRGRFVRVTSSGAREGTPHVQGKISEH